MKRKRRNGRKWGWGGEKHDMELKNMTCYMKNMTCYMKNMTCY